MSVRIHVSGAAAAAVAEHVPGLVTSLIASRITDKDDTIWGPDAQTEASVRLGWVSASLNVGDLVEEVGVLRRELHAKGLHRIVLAGMGGSSLAPEVIANTAGADLTILDSTSPGQVLSAVATNLEATVLVVSSKSGSTVETDSAKRVFEKAFNDAGIDPRERIIVVTDPGSPLDAASRKAGYRVFNADPNVGGRFSALTAFGIVPTALAGVNVAEIIGEANAAVVELAIDSPENPGLILGAAIAKSFANSPKIALVSDGTHIVGLGDWVEQLVAESTGKSGVGILPVVLDTVASELNGTNGEIQIVRFVDDAHERHLLHHDRHEGEILLSGSLGGLFQVWEFATAVAGYLLGIDPFNQPDVESAKVAARALLSARPEAATPAVSFGDIDVYSRGVDVSDAVDLRSAITTLLTQAPDGGYVAIQAYVDRTTLPELSGVRDLVAARAKHPVTFGWGPRFLHSTGQFHKGGYPTGVFIQIIQKESLDIEIPGLGFTFGTLIAAQAQGDAEVLAQHGRPVFTISIPSGDSALLGLFEAFN